MKSCNLGNVCVEINAWCLERDRRSVCCQKLEENQLNSCWVRRKSVAMVDFDDCTVWKVIEMFYCCMWKAPIFPSKTGIEGLDVEPS